MTTDTAEVAELVDAWVSKTHENYSREGSIPSLGTAFPQVSPTGKQL